MKTSPATQLDTETPDDFESTQFRLEDKNAKYAFEAMTQYSNPIGSVVREITSNCFDSHERAGVDRDVEIEIKDGSKLEGEDIVIEFRDYGTGLSEQKVQEVFTSLFESDKRDTNEIGGFGIGAKSPFGYVRNAEIGGFYVDTWHNGTHWKYFLTQSKSGAEMIEIMKESSDRENGTTVTVPIADFSDKRKFQKEIKKQLAYFDNITYINCGVPNSDYRVIKGNHFIYREDHQPFDDLHICLGKVAYPLDFSQLPNYNNRGYGYKRSFSAPLALHIGIDEVPSDTNFVVWNREQVEYNDSTVELIESKIAALKGELQELFDEQSKNISSFEDYYKALKANDSQSIVVQKDDEDFEIPVSSGLIDNPKPKYPKYDVDIPTSGNKLFVGWKVYKKVNNKGYVESHFSEDRWIDNYIGKDNVLIVDDSYSPKTNQYIASRFGEGWDHFYLLKHEGFSLPSTSKPFGSWVWKNHEDIDEPDGDKLEVDDFTKEKQTLLAVWATLFNQNIVDRSETVSWDILREYKQFFDEVNSFVLDEFTNYDTYEPTEEFEEWRKKQLKNRKSTKKKRGKDKFPVKRIGKDSSYGSDYKWNMGEMKYDHLVDDKTIIYGFQEDDDNLLALGPFYYALPDSTRKRRSKNWSDGPSGSEPRNVEILKIAMKREYLFEDLDNAYHVDEFVKSDHPILVRPCICHWLYENLPSINNSRILKEVGILDRVKHHLDLSPYNRSSMHSVMDVEINGENIYDRVLDEYDVENRYQDYIDVANGINKMYPLLDEIRYYNVKDMIEEVQVYVDAKSKVHPRLIGKQERLSDN
jgi:hypothetical protein